MEALVKGQDGGEKKSSNVVPDRFQFGRLAAEQAALTQTIWTCLCSGPEMYSGSHL